MRRLTRGYVRAAWLLATLAPGVVCARPAHGPPEQKSAPANAHEAAASDPSAQTNAGNASTKPPEHAKRKWYGGQTLISDFAALSLLVLGADVSEHSAKGHPAPPLLFTGAGLAWFLGPPIIHVTHDNVGRGVASLVMRTATAGMTIIGGAGCAVGDSVAGCAVALVGILGVPTTIILDAAVFAYEEPLGVSPAAQQARPSGRVRPGSRYGLSFMPMHDPRREAWSLMAMAAF